MLKRGDLLRLETCVAAAGAIRLERDPERVAVFADVLTPYGFAETNLRERFLASSADRWLGTDQIGRSASAPSALRASSRRRWGSSAPTGIPRSSGQPPLTSCPEHGVVHSAERTMAQHPVEMILMRQLADHLSVPVVLVDTAGTVIFYNEPAERILGLRFEETGPIDRKEADRLVELSDDPAAEACDAGHPMEIALGERRPAHAHRLMLRRTDRVRLQIEITAFPLIGQEGKLLGAVAMFWERPGP